MKYLKIEEIKWKKIIEANRRSSNKKAMEENAEEPQSGNALLLLENSIDPTIVEKLYPKYRQFTLISKHAQFLIFSGNFSFQYLKSGETAHF